MAALSMMLMIVGVGGILLGWGWMVTDGAQLRNMKPAVIGLVLLSIGFAIPIDGPRLDSGQTPAQPDVTTGTKSPHESPPDLQLAPWPTVSTRMQFACGTDPKGQASCWGEPVDIGDDPIVQIVFGREHGCALRTTGLTQCWGSAEGENQRLQKQRFSTIASSLETTCGLSKEGEIHCWGDAMEPIPSTPRFATISGGASHFCGVTTGGEAICWGDNQEGQSTPVDGQYISVSAGHFHSCGIQANSMVTCWGRDAEGQSTPPQTRFRQISAGWSHTCGIDQTGRIECWGCESKANAVAMEPSHPCRPPAGQFVAVSAGDLWQSCAINGTGNATCWGGIAYAGEPQ